MGFEQRTKTAITALALFLEGCAAELATRTPAEEPPSPVPETAIATPPQLPPQIEEAPEGPKETPRRPTITLGQNAGAQSLATSAEVCTPMVAQAANAMVDHARPIQHHDGLIINYEITTDEEFDDHYDEDTDRVADYYVAMIERVSAHISGYADIEFRHQRHARPEEQDGEVWFSIVLSGETPQGIAGSTTPAYYTNGDFAYADIVFFVPSIELMRQEGVRNAPQQTVQHEFQHGLGLGPAGAFEHVEDIFPALRDSRGNYHFTVAVSPETTAMTIRMQPRFDNRAELDLCALQKLYGAVPSEVDPADAAPAGRSQRTRDRR